MHRADSKGVGATLTRDLGKYFQGLCVAKAAIALASERIQLCTQTPGPGRRVVDGVRHAVALRGGDGEGEVLIINLGPVITDRNHAWKPGVGVQLNVQGAAGFQVDDTVAMGVEVAGQVQPSANIGGQQGGQAFVLLFQLQIEQAGFYRFGRVGRQSEPGQHRFEYVGRDMLRCTVGIDPVHCQACTAGQYFKLRFTHGRSPAGDD